MRRCLLVALLMLAGCDAQTPTSIDTSAAMAPAKPSLSALDMHGNAESDKAEALLAEACPALTRAQQAGEIASVTHQIGMPESKALQEEGWKRSIRIDTVMADVVRSVDARPSPAGQHCSFELGAAGFVSGKQACLAMCEAGAKEDGSDYRLLPVDTAGLHLPVVSTDYVATPITDVLDVNELRKALNLSASHVEHYDDGRVRLWWPIQLPGGVPKQIEIKGYDLHDADDIAWGCSEFDTKGSRLDPARPESFCANYFKRVLGIVVAHPEALAAELLKRSSAVEQSWILARVGNFVIETNGDAYFIRHQVPL